MSRSKLEPTSQQPGTCPLPPVTEGRFSQNPNIQALFRLALAFRPSLDQPTIHEQLAFAIIERDAARAHLHTVRFERDAAHTEFMARVTDLQASLATSDGNIQTVLEALIQAQADLKAAQTPDTSSLQSAITAAQSQVEQAKQKHTQIAITLAQTQKDYDTTLADLDTRLALAETDLAAKEAHVAALEQALANQQKNTSKPSSTAKNTNAPTYTHHSSRKRERETDHSINRLLASQTTKGNGEAAKAKEKRRRLEEKRRIIAFLITQQQLHQDDIRFDNYRIACAQS